MAVGYAVIGVIVRQTTLEPSSLPPLWPGAGLAFAAAVLWGNSGMAGLLVGCIGLALVEASMDDPQVALPLVLLGSVFYGLMTVAQAWAGARLWGRYGRGPGELVESRDIGRMLIFAGPVACLLGSTSNCAIMLAADLIQWSDVPVHWTHFYFSGISGVMLISPIVFAIAGRHRAHWKGRVGIVVAPLLSLGGLLAIMLHLGVAREVDEMTSQTKRTGDDFVGSLDARIADLERLVMSVTVLGDFEEQDGQGSRDRFRAYARRVLGELPELVSLSWHPWSEDGARALSEERSPVVAASAAGDGLSESAGSVAAPVEIVEVDGPNRGGRGLEILFGEENRAGLRQWLEGGGLVVTPPMRHGPEAGAPADIFMLMPTRDPVVSPSSPRDRSKAPNGVVVAGIRAQNLLAEVAVSSSAGSIRVVDTEEGGLVGAVGPGSQTRLSFTERPVEIANRLWRAEIGVLSGGYAGAQSSRPTVALALGTTLASLITLLLLLLSGRNFAGRRRAQQLVRVNQVLEAEVHRRQVAQRALSAEKEHAEYQARHDPLTGLVNRREFERRVKGLLEQSDSGRLHALAFLDLDQFKIVNDTVGHVAGDELLKTLAERLASFVRGNDTIARLGGDEFGVVLVDVPLERAFLVLDRLVQAVKDFRFRWADRVFPVGISAGLVAVEDGGPDLAELLSRADVACYAAKELGGSRVHVYHDGDDHAVRRHGEIHRATKLREALVDGRLRLARQPIIALGAEEETHYEILLRIVDDEGDLCTPGGFIPAAERFGLMPEIDRWVIAGALKLAADWENTATVAINLSGASITEPDLAEHVRRVLQETGFPPSRVCFEITETAAVRNVEAACRFIKELHSAGCRFALDDFGTGLASFGYLRTFEVDFLKIDGSFVRDLDDPVHVVMVQAIASLAAALGIQTIAECAETPEVVERLRGLGIDYAQGWALGHPEPADGSG